jgi:hypothetical protein
MTVDEYEPCSTLVVPQHPLTHAKYPFDSSLTEYHVYFRVLETADEYFDYYRRRHAFWKMYGLELPDDVLKKIYYRNALRLIPGIDASLFPK